MSDVRKWNPPSEGSTERKEDMPRDAFLDPKGRRYPFKYENSKGEWVESFRGLMAARSRAAQQGDTSIFEEATRKLNRMREEREEEPLSLQMDAVHIEINGAFNREIILPPDDTEAFKFGIVFF